MELNDLIFYLFFGGYSATVYKIVRFKADISVGGNMFYV